MEQIIKQFYEAFKNLDAEKMTTCYHNEIIFEDPAFGILKETKAKNMWRMLCESQKGKSFVVTYSNVNNNSANWEATYLFSQTGKEVHNIITAKFEFKDGLIIKHTDDFDLHKWAKQAFGFKGVLLGGTSFFKKKLNNQTSILLTRFEEKNT